MTATGWARERVLELQAARLRVAIWVLLFAIVLFGFFEVALDTEDAPALLVLKGVQLVFSFSLLWALTRFPRRAAPLALAGAAFLCASATASNVLRGDLVTMPLLATILLAGSATLFPWGAGYQAGATAAAVLALLANVYFVDGHFDAVLGYPALGLGVFFAVCVFIARSTARQLVASLLRERERDEALAALRRSEQYFRLLNENALDLVAVLRLDGTCAYASPSHERVLGYRPEEIVGRKAFELVHPDDVGRVVEVFAREVERSSPGVPHSIEARFLHKDGSWRTLECIGSLLGPELGGGVVVNSRDVTERKTAEERTRALLEVAQALSGTLDLEEALRSVEEAAVRSVPCTAALTVLVGAEGKSPELASAFGVEAGKVEELRKALGGVGKLSVEKLPRSASAVEPGCRLEEPLRTLERMLGHRRMVVAPLRGRERVLGFFVVCREGTGAFEAGELELCDGLAKQLAQAAESIFLYSRQAEEAEVSGKLAEVGRALIATLARPKLLETLCETAARSLGGDAAHTFVWDAAEEVFVPTAGFGDSPEEWEALRVLKVPRNLVSGLLAELRQNQVAFARMSEPQDLVPPALPLRYGITAALYMALWRGEEIVGIQTVAWRGREPELGSKELRIARGISQIASLAFENARLVEDLEDANRLKSEFVATMSHELRTPINVILGYADLLRDGVFGELSQEQETILERIERAAAQLHELITATLDMSRLESGRLPVVFEQVDLRAILAEVEEEAREQKDRKPSVELLWEVPEEPLPVRTDPSKVKVILKNLVGNALKFTEVGEVRVSAGCDGADFHIRVRDTGIGIPREQLGSIFEPFRQVDGSTTRKYGGVGLGLYIVRRLVELLGGSVQVESEQGVGTTFTVTLPSRIGEQDLRPPLRA